MKNLPRLKSDTIIKSGEWLIIDVENGLWNVLALPTGEQLIESLNKNMLSDKKWDIKTTKIIDIKTAMEMGLITLTEDNQFFLSEVNMESAKIIKKGQNKLK